MVKIVFARLAPQSEGHPNVLFLIEQQVLKGSLVFDTECIHGKVKKKKINLPFSQIGILARLYVGFRLLLFSAMSYKFGYVKDR